MGYGSAPGLMRHGVPRPRRGPWRPCHRSPPVCRWRVPWGPWWPSSPTRGACAWGAPPRGDGLPLRRLRRPLRHAASAAGGRPAAPPASWPRPWAAYAALPGGRWADAKATRPGAWVSPGPRRSWRLPRLWSPGQTGRPLPPLPPSPGARGPDAPRASLLAGAPDGPPRQGLSGPACHRRACPRCRGCPLASLRPAPTAGGRGSRSWGLAGAGRSPPRVVEDAALQGRIGALYTRGVAPCFPAACTAHRAAAGSRPLQAWRSVRTLRQGYMRDQHRFLSQVAAPIDARSLDGMPSASRVRRHRHTIGRPH